MWAALLNETGGFQVIATCINNGPKQQSKAKAKTFKIKNPRDFLKYKIFDTYKRN
jgi:hypothetical protein